MPTDCAGTLRIAEKLLRLGWLDEAIAEFCLELRADAEDYRDLTAPAQRLSKLQMGE